MESTKAQINGQVNDIFGKVVEALPKEKQKEFLAKVQNGEIEGVFCMFFTSVGSLGLCCGSFDIMDVATYSAEIMASRDVAMLKGEEVVTEDDMKSVQEVLGGKKIESEGNIASRVRSRKNRRPTA